MIEDTYPGDEPDSLAGASDFSSTEEQFRHVRERIRDKLDDYDGYDFSLIQLRALNIFFDLSQEVRGRDMFYAVCMMIPNVLFGLDSSIYILEDEETFVLAGCSTGRCGMEPTRTWDEELQDRIILSDEVLYIPIFCNPEYADMLSFKPPHNILGSFVLTPCGSMPGHSRLFLEKFVNRIGYQLHQRIIRSRNREHLRFIKSMVQDIGHNVIVPNMYFKLYFNRLRRQIEALHLNTQDMLGTMNACEDETCIEKGNALVSTVTAIEAQYQEIYRHYETTSMFLETLLRRSHFEEGRYVLMKREVNLRINVIEPQVERYRQRLADRGIEIGYALGGAPDQMIRIIMDPGLIAQVYANFFSNALKYTEEIELEDGRTGKYVSYGWQILKDHFGENKPGIKLWVCSSGKGLVLSHPMEVFEPGFRADNVNKERGTGRGLYFVRQVVELHGGTVGYAHTDSGNEFSFILPLEQSRD